jgi:uncharacterized protein (DUF1697 family)
MKFIALLRGVNVGGRCILPMQELKNLLLELKCINVKTYIQSGNVVFEREMKSNEHFTRDVEESIEKRYHFKPKIILLDEQEMKNAICNNPFSTKDGKALHFFFLDSHPKHPDIEKLEILKLNSEEFKLQKDVFYLYAPNGIGRSKLAANIERCLGVPATGRNWNTIMQLTQMISENKA